jgi:hypothetical protein
LAIPPFRDDGWLPVGHHEAGWDEIVARLGGVAGSRRRALTDRLLELRAALVACGVSGYFLLNGSYVSSTPDPGDFDVLLVGPPDIQAKKEGSPELSEWLDSERAEKERGYSLFYVPLDSPALPLIVTFWDLSKQGVAKGSVKVHL